MILGRNCFSLSFTIAPLYSVHKAWSMHAQGLPVIYCAYVCTRVVFPFLSDLHEKGGDRNRLNMNIILPSFSRLFLRRERNGNRNRRYRYTHTHIHIRCHEQSERGNNMGCISKEDMDVTCRRSQSLKRTHRMWMGGEGVAKKWSEKREKSSTL